MPSTFREKICLNCSKTLVLRCVRDVERKNFCSRSCKSSFCTSKLWQLHRFRDSVSASNRGPHPLRGHKGELHPQYGKKWSDERKKAWSDKISSMIQSGKFVPHSHHKSGWQNTRFGKFFFRSSLEKEFLRVAEQDETIVSIKSSPFKILYNRTRNYLPDFLIENGKEKILVEVKPARRIHEPDNQAKFCATQKFCVAHGMKFEVFTEKNVSANAIVI